MCRHTDEDEDVHVPFTLLLIIVILSVMLLSGCASLPALDPTSPSPVCAALIGPIKTNTTKPTSKRYLPVASTALRADIKQRNQVGANLKCPAYK